MEKTNNTFESLDVFWGVNLPPLQRKIIGPQGPEPVSVTSFGRFLAGDEYVFTDLPQVDPEEAEINAIVLRHLSVAPRHEVKLEFGPEEIAEAA